MRGRGIAVAQFMPQLSEEDLRKAEIIWRANCFPYQEEDQIVEPFLNDKIRPGRGVGLKNARLASLITVREAAARLKVTAGAYRKFERNEQSGSISLNTLFRAAEALDCELVYSLRPKSGQNFSKRIWQALLPLCLASRRKYAWNFRYTAFAAIARDLMLDPKSRSAFKWSQRQWFSRPHW